MNAHLFHCAPFRTPQDQIIEYLSNATEPKQTTRSLSAAARRVRTNNHDRDKRDEIEPAVGQEGRNLVHYPCICACSFGLRRLPSRPRTRNGHWRHGGSSPPPSPPPDGTAASRP